MSTSPSWFDQEKFSRLVKKVGPKNIPEPPPAAPPSQSPPPGTNQDTVTAVAPTPLAPAAPVTPPAPEKSPSASQRLPEAEPAPAAPDENAAPAISAPSESLASTARISLVSKPPSLLSENRALPALPRRTTPLPGLKSLFQYPPAAEKPSVATPASPAMPPPLPEAPAAKSGALPKADTGSGTLPPPEAKVVAPPHPEAKSGPLSKSDAKSGPLAKPDAQPEAIPEVKDEPKDASQFVGDLPEPSDTSEPMAEDDDLSGIWQKMALLNEELAQTIQERDHALNDINILRDQLQHVDAVVERNKRNATPGEFAQVAQERDDALSELKALKDKAAADESPKFQLPEGVTKTKELVFLAQERDQARKEYADLRKQFETFKRDQTGQIPNVREDSGKYRKELEQQLEGFRVKLEEKNRELASIKTNGASAAAAPSSGGGEAEEKLKSEIASMKEQLVKSKEDTSIAQRGLALSQKALQETRDTLREATEGTSLSRHNFDNLKTECATLTQQNTVLQAQNEQLSREVAAFKASKSGRLT